MRYTPFESLDRMMDQLRRDMLEMRESMAGSWPALDAPSFGAAVDLTERDDAYVVTVDLPGFEREEIDLRYDDGRLWLAAEHEADDEGVTRHRAVREQVAIPRTVDADAITASYHNGVLEVHLPAVEDVDDVGHRIDID